MTWLMDLVAVFKLVAWLAAFFDAAVAVFVLFFATRRRAGAEHGKPAGLFAALASLTAAATSWMVKSLAAAVLGVGAFGLMRLAYLWLAVVPASVGLAILLLSRRGTTARGVSGASVVLGVLMLLPAPICAYASLVAPFQLVVERRDVPLAIPALRDSEIRIGVFADLQTDRIGPYEHEAIDRLLAEKPDLILIPGDLFQMPQRRMLKMWPQLRALIDRLEAPFGAFAVLGNIDWPEETARLLDGSPVRLLNNEITTIDVRGVRVEIGGVDLTYSSRSAARVLSGIGRGDADLSLLIAHLPDVAYAAAPDGRIDLIVSGHTHGGQVVIPGFGPLLTLSRVPRRVAAGGLHRVNGHAIYVSRGVGHERGIAPPIRFFCPPEISILTLRGDTVPSP